MIGVLEHIAALLAAIVTVLAALPLLAVIAVAFGGLGFAAVILCMIFAFMLARRMVRRRQAARAARGADVYAESFGDVPYVNRGSR